MCAQGIQKSRRNFLNQLVRWAGWITGILLCWPLFRFLGFTVKPKPRFVTVTAPLPASGFHAEKDFILFVNNSAATAISRTCTHLGCRVNFLEDKQLIECPCHQSRFSMQGVLISGPAKKDLPTYPVETRTDEKGKVTGYVVTL